jgi:hypothetical protein
MNIAPALAHPAFLPLGSDLSVNCNLNDSIKRFNDSIGSVRSHCHPTKHLAYPWACFDLTSIAFANFETTLTKTPIVIRQYTIVNIFETLDVGVRSP